MDRTSFPLAFRNSTSRGTGAAAAALEDGRIDDVWGRLAAQDGQDVTNCWPASRRGGTAASDHPPERTRTVPARMPRLSVGTHLVETVARGVADDNAVLGGSLEIDRVDTDAVAHDHPALCQLGDHLAREECLGEHGSGIPGRQRRSA